jgi:hypothetical protein
MWSDTHLYITLMNTSDDNYEIVEMDLATWKCSGPIINIVGTPQMMFVDNDRFTTIIAKGLNNTDYVYRFPLR